MCHVELRHLRYFVAVAEEEHVTRAAERLNIQQPPLSQQIRALETELGVPLFRRKARGIALTEAGRLFLEDVRAILAQVDHAVAAVKRAARGEQGRLAVGFTSSAPFHPFLPAVLRRFRDAFPGVALAMEESGTAELVEALRSERIDVAFVRSPIAEGAGLDVLPLLEEEMLAALPAGHRLAAGKRAAAALPLAALASEPFILYRRSAGAGLYDAIIAACHGAGFNPQLVQEAPRILSTLNLVAAGLGVSIVPASLGRLALAGVAYRRLRTRPPLVAPLHLAMRRREGSAVVRRFVELVGRAAAAPRAVSAGSAAPGSPA
ncbi:MAG: LysR family transcriptional regulator [Alphaproteobacteria bacterium]|nr:LysR family transcriptional regulator [Alphaproteobacteria bacterium]